MKFQYIPNIVIVDYEKLKNVCTFDENGFYETDDTAIINFIKSKKPFVKVIQEPEAEAEKEPKKHSEVFYNCSKCEYKTTNKGELMAHYRKFHPKKEG
jgi:hypothetical protein